MLLPSTSTVHICGIEFYLWCVVQTVVKTQNPINKRSKSYSSLRHTESNQFEKIGMKSCIFSIGLTGFNLKCRTPWHFILLVLSFILLRIN